MRGRGIEHDLGGSTSSGWFDLLTIETRRGDRENFRDVRLSSRIWFSINLFRNTSPKNWFHEAGFLAISVRLWIYVVNKAYRIETITWESLVVKITRSKIVSITIVSSCTIRLICVISELVDITNYKLHIWNTNEFSYVTATSVIKKKNKLNFTN